MVVAKRVQLMATRMVAPVAIVAAAFGAGGAAQAVAAQTTTYDLTYMVSSSYQIDNIIDFDDYTVDDGARFGYTGPPRTVGPVFDSFTVSDVALPGYFFFAGTTDILVSARSSAVAAAPRDTHLVLAVNDAFAEAAALRGDDFSVLFADFTASGYSEDDLIGAILCKNANTCAEGDDPATTLLFKFQAAMNSASADLLIDPLTPGTFSLLAFSSGQPIGSGTTASVARPLASGVVPEPATWAMMVGGFGLVGGAMRRRRATVRFA